MLGFGPTNPLSPGVLLFCSSSCLSHGKLPVAHKAEGCWAFWLWGHCMWKQSSNGFFFRLNHPLSSFMFVWLKSVVVQSYENEPGDGKRHSGPTWAFWRGKLSFLWLLKAGKAEQVRRTWLQITHCAMVWLRSEGKRWELQHKGSQKAKSNGFYTVAFQFPFHKGFCVHLGRGGELAAGPAHGSRGGYEGDAERSASLLCSGRDSRCSKPEKDPECTREGLIS